MNSAKRFAPRLAAALVALAGLGLGGCEDLLMEDPPHEIVAENLYTDAAGFRAGLNALYAQARRERQGADGVNELMSEPWTVGVDNAFSNYVSTNERIWNEWGVRNNSEAGIYGTVWTWLYRAINSANTIVNRAENPEVEWTEEEKNEMVAEARLFRAWAYRHLTYLWGDVPLTLEEASGSEIRTDWERAPVAEVRTQMEQDLLFAEAHLPPVPATDGRVSRAVAQHYLAELYLATGRDADAEAKARAVTESGNFSLITARYGVRRNGPGTPFTDQFLDGNVNRSQGNTEVLWAFQFELDVPGGGQSAMRRYWVNRYYNIRGVVVTAENGGRGIGRLSPTRWAINLYEPQDQRGGEHAIRKFYLYNDAATLPAGKRLGDTVKLVWTAEKINDANWPSVRKWDWTDPNNVSGDAQFGDQPYLRLAETYLLLAEAQLRQGRPDDAATTLNVLRRRAGATEVTGAQVTLDFILDERSRELLTEEHRRYTLLRTGTWLERTKAHNPLARPNVTERDALFPIPQSVINANLTVPMPQNPGY